MLDNITDATRTPITWAEVNIIILTRITHATWSHGHQTISKRTSASAVREKRMKAKQNSIHLNTLWYNQIETSQPINLFFQSRERI